MISESVERKFINEIDIVDWEIDTDSGWENISSIKKTVKYEVWYLKTASGLILECADNHIIYNEQYKEIFVKDCVPYKTFIITEFGIDQIIKLYNKQYSENMYDITVCSNTHRYYTNNILSHNTTCAAAFLLWKAMFMPDATILVTSHQLSGASEIMQRIRYAYEELPNFIRAGVTEYNKGSITFDNGSRILSQATTEKTGRGLALTLVYLDEFAYVEPRIAQEFWTSISPTLSTGGHCIITSTPNTEIDQFSSIWRAANKTVDEYGNERENGLGVNNFKAFSISWKDVPRDIPHEEFEKKMRSQLGDERWLREFNCQFISFEETLIDSIHLKDMIGEEPYYTTGRIRWYSELLPNRMYLVSLDPSMGTGRDNAAITVWMMPEFKQVAEWYHNKTDTAGQVKLLMSIVNTINADLKKLSGQIGKPEIYWTVENNSLGEAVLTTIADTGEDKFAGEFVSEPNKKRRGFNTTHKSKLNACARLKNLVESGKIDIKSKNLISELKSFIRKNRSYAAHGTNTDDLISSTLLTIRMIEVVKYWDEQLYDRLANIIESEDDDLGPMPLIIA